MTTQTELPEWAEKIADKANAERSARELEARKQAEEDTARYVTDFACLLAELNIPGEPTSLFLEVDGYRFAYRNRRMEHYGDNSTPAHVALIEFCPFCHKEHITDIWHESRSTLADLLVTPLANRHTCRIEEPSSKPAVPAPVPTTGEKLLAALADFIAEQRGE